MSDTIESTTAPVVDASPAASSAAPVAATPAVLEMQSWDAAYEAAKQKVSATPQEQALAVDAGASTLAGSDDEKPAEAGAAISAEGKTSPDSTAIEAPEHWPEEAREAFASLPEAAKARELEFYKGQQAAFTKGMQALKQREGELGQIVDLAQRYQQGPDAAREVLQRLADAANIPVWFEPPEPEQADEAPPEFADAQELAKWARDQALKAVQKTRQSEARQQQAQLAEMQKREQFRDELAAAMRDYPDLGQHKDGIMERLERSPNLSVEQAYQLTTWASLRKLALEGDAARKELQAIKAREKASRAAVTRTPAGQAGVADARAITDPWEQAYEKGLLSIANRRKSHGIR